MLGYLTMIHAASMQPSRNVSCRSRSASPLLSGLLPGPLAGLAGSAGTPSSQGQGQGPGPDRRSPARAGRGTLAALVAGSLALGGALGCSAVIDPDPYLGTIDPSGFATQVRFATGSNPTAACLIPRHGWAGSAEAPWVYLGVLTNSQLDLSNAADPTRALPPSVYQLTGCDAPEGRQEASAFDPRLDNYLHTVQYPILATGFVPAQAGAAAEPANLSTYRPFHAVIKAQLEPSVRDRMGCNDVKSERSLLERAGWNRENKMFPEGGPRDIQIQFATREQIQSGQLTFKDWPMVSVAVPVGTTWNPAAACPFGTGNQAVLPKFPGDPQATFQFPSQHWLRGLLGGYLDGGTVPVTTDRMQCPAIVPTVKSCSAMTPCDGAAGEVCSAGRCLARVPVCPVQNELWLSKDEVKLPAAGAATWDPFPSGERTVEIKSTDGTMKRSGDILSIFKVLPGQPDFSPVCRVRVFDPAKVTCAQQEGEALKPRPLCTAAELSAQPMAEVSLGSTPYYVHCLYVNPPKAS